MFSLSISLHPQQPSTSRVQFLRSRFSHEKLKKSKLLKNSDAAAKLAKEIIASLENDLEKQKQKTFNLESKNKKLSKI